MMSTSTIQNKAQINDSLLRTGGPFPFLRGLADNVLVRLITSTNTQQKSLCCFFHPFTQTVPPNNTSSVVKSHHHEMMNMWLQAYNCDLRTWEQGGAGGSPLARDQPRLPSRIYGGLKKTLRHHLNLLSKK